MADNQTVDRTVCCVFSSPLGFIHAEFCLEGLARLTFSEQGKSLSESVEEVPEIAHRLRIQLKEYFSGDRKTFDIPLAPAGSDFQRKVWDLISEIPYGETWSYQESAEAYGDVRSIRAIAAANGANPIPILIPCHRVIGSDGNLTGYSGGLWRKEFLLDLEKGQSSLF